MATKMERLQTVLATVKNSDDVSLADARKVAEAFGYTYRRGETLTNAQEAGAALQEIKRFVNQITRDANVSRAAAEAAEAAAAGASIDLGADENE